MRRTKRFSKTRLMPRKGRFTSRCPDRSAKLSPPGKCKTPTIMIDFRKGRGNSSHEVVDGESQITIYEKSAPAEVMQAVLGHEIAHHIDKFGYSTLIQEQLLGSVEKNKPGIFLSSTRTANPSSSPSLTGGKFTRRTRNLPSIDKFTWISSRLRDMGLELWNIIATKRTNSEIAREIFASHGAAEFFGGKFVKDNYVEGRAQN